MWELNGEEVELKWDKGRLTGDDLAVETIESEARMADSVGPPTGPFTGTDHLKNELSAMVLIIAWMDFDSVKLIEGEWPQAPPLPDDVVG